MSSSFRQVRCLVTRVDVVHGRIRYPVSGTAESETFFFLFFLFFTAITRRRCVVFPSTLLRGCFILVHALLRRRRQRGRLVARHLPLWDRSYSKSSESMQTEPRSDNQVRSEREPDIRLAIAHYIHHHGESEREMEATAGETRGKSKREKSQGQNPMLSPQDILAK